MSSYIDIIIEKQSHLFCISFYLVADILFQIKLWVLLRREKYQSLRNQGFLFLLNSLLFTDRSQIIQMKSREVQTNISQNQDIETSVLGKHLLFPRVEQFLAFERSCQQFTSGYIELLSFSLVLHTFIGYLLLSKHPFSLYATQIVTLFRTQAVPYRIFQISAYMLNLLLILSLFGARLKFKTTIWFSSIKKIISIYGVLGKFSLLLTSLLLYINLWENIVALLLSISLFVFKSLFIGNYSAKKEQNYQSSHLLSLVLRIGTIAHTVINCLLVHYGSLQGFCSSAALFGILTLIWHAKGGYGLFLHRTARKVHLLFCGAMVSTGLIYLLLIRPRKENATFNIVEWCFSMAIVTFYLSQFQKKKRFTFANPSTVIEEQRSMNEYQLNLTILLQESEDCLNKENILLGILALAANTCPSAHCWLKEKSVFDPIIKRTFNPKMVFRQKDSVFRFFLKCIYTRALEHKKTKTIMMDYAQFCITEMGDFSKHCLLLTELQELPDLGFLEKIKIHKLKITLREQSEAFNRLIFGGKVELDEVLASEQTFDFILKNINQYCHRSADIWREATQRQVDIFSLKEKMNENFQLIPLLNQKWNSISKLLTIQRHWRFVYLNFALFLKNEKVRSKDISPQSLDEDEYDISEITPMNRDNAAAQPNFSDSLYFDKRTTMIMCVLEDELRFQRVSKSFQELTGYNEQEIKGSSLRMILPYQIRERHNRIVESWLEQGRTTDQTTYYVKHAHYIDKYDKQIDAIVIFKIYVDLSATKNTLKFIALIKGIQSEQSLIKNQIQITSKKKTGSSVVNLLQKSMVKGEGKGLGLKSQNNIFIKDENLQPTKHVGEIKKIKIVMRLLTLILIGLLLSLVLSVKADVKKTDEHGQAILLFSYLYNQPFNIAKMYYSILSSGGFYGSFLTKKMQIAFQDFKQHLSNPLTTRTLFDRTLNEAREYPPLKVNPTNQGVNYTNADLFYLIVSSLTTLSKNDFKSTDHDFLILNSYLMPSFSLMMNSTMQKLHQQLSGYLKTFRNNQMIYMGGFSSVLLLTACYLCYQVYRYFSSMRDAIDIMVQFSNQDIAFIVKYWKALQLHFGNMEINNRGHKSQNQIDEVEEQDIYSEEEVDNKTTTKASLNQRHKNLLVSNKEKLKQYKTCLMLLMLMVGFIPAVVSIQAVNLMKISELIRFEEAGHNFDRYFPSTTIAAYGAATKHYSGSQPFEVLRYDDTLSAIKITMDYTYLPGISAESTYYQKQQAYLFGNPCAYNPQLLKRYAFSADTCDKFADSSLTQGLTAYLRYVYPILNDYMHSKRDITEKQFSDILRGMAITGYFIEDALKTWFDQFTLMLNNFQSQSSTQAMLVCFLLLFFHVLIFQVFVLANLLEDYAFMKMVFVSCIPEHILTKEKVIKHRFYQSGILVSS